AAHLLHRDRIESGKRLVHQEEMAAAKKLLRNRDALPLAARELARIALREVVEAESLQHFHRTVTRLGRRLAALRRRDRQIAEDRPVLEQLIVLKNDADHPRFDR